MLLMVTGGGTYGGLTADGLGQNNLITRTNGPSGAGSQFDFPSTGAFF